MEFITEFFSSDYMPHGHCFLWLPGILWLTVGADALIAISYFSIPIALLIFISKRPELQFRGIAILFAAFIFTPWLAMRFKPSLEVLRAAADKEHREAERVESFFRRMINPLIDEKWKGRAFLIGLIVVFFLCCLLLFLFNSSFCLSDSICLILS